MRRRAESGFTLMEIMVSLALVGVLAGVVQLLTTSIRANRTSRQLDRAAQLVDEVMESLRGTTTAKIVAGTPAFPDVESVGVSYHRTYSAVAISGQASLVLVTATVSYVDDEDQNITHTRSVRMVRTTVETL